MAPPGLQPIGRCLHDCEFEVRQIRIECRSHTLTMLSACNRSGRTVGGRLAQNSECGEKVSVSALQV